MMQQRYVGFRRRTPPVHPGWFHAENGVMVRQGGRYYYWLLPAPFASRWLPHGFDWGNHGSAAAQLALALAYDATEDRRRAAHVCGELLRRVVAHLPSERWSLTYAEVLAAIQQIEDEEPVGELGQEDGDL